MNCSMVVDCQLYSLARSTVRETLRHLADKGRIKLVSDSPLDAPSRSSPRLAQPAPP